MTQVFKDDGTVVPVTRVQAGPCVVTYVKTKDHDGVDALQIGFGEQKAFRIAKPIQGHLNGLAMVRHMKEVRTEDAAHGLQRGDQFTVSIFQPGDVVQVTGKSKGKGFQGVVKRHGFRGAKASHGTKDQERMPGSIGSTGPQRVFKGTRMGGHMGDAQVTVKNLEIIEIKPETNELWIKGAVPGARGGLLVISTPDGAIEIEIVNQALEAPVEAVEAEAPLVESTEAEVSNVTTAEAPVSEAEETKEAA